MRRSLIALGLLLVVVPATTYTTRMVARNVDDSDDEEDGLYKFASRALLGRTRTHCEMGGRWLTCTHVTLSVHVPQ